MQHIEAILPFYKNLSIKLLVIYSRIERNTKNCIISMWLNLLVKLSQLSVIKIINRSRSCKVYRFLIGALQFNSFLIFVVFVCFLLCSFPCELIVGKIKTDKISIFLFIFVTNYQI